MIRPMGVPATDDAAIERVRTEQGSEHAGEIGGGLELVTSAATTPRQALLVKAGRLFAQKLVNEQEARERAREIQRALQDKKDEMKAVIDRGEFYGDDEEHAAYRVEIRQEVTTLGDDLLEALSALERLGWEFDAAIVELCETLTVLTESPPDTASIAAVEAAAEAFAAAVVAEAELEDERPLIKAEAIKRIMQRDGIPATPAEKIVETDEAFMAHRRKQRESVVTKIRAHGVYKAAQLRARLSIELWAGSGVA